MSKPLACGDITICGIDDLMRVLNLIEKQQKDYESCMDYADSLNQDIGELLLKLEKQEKEIELAKKSLIENANIADERNQKKDKMIDLMARAINSYDSQLEINTYKDKEDVIKKFKELAIEYFSKKVSKENGDA